jgi:hypothetical protein
LGGEVAFQLRQIHASSCVSDAQKSQKCCFLLQNPCHFGTQTSPFFIDFARAALCFHRLTGFGRTKKGIPFSGILRRKHSSVLQGHVAFRLAKYLHQFSEQRVRGLGGSQSRPGRSGDRARRGV